MWVCQVQPVFIQRKPYLLPHPWQPWPVFTLQHQWSRSNSKHLDVTQQTGNGNLNISWQWMSPFQPLHPAVGGSSCHWGRGAVVEEESEIAAVTLWHMNNRNLDIIIPHLTVTSAMQLFYINRATGKWVLGFLRGAGEGSQSPDVIILWMHPQVNSL